MTELVDLATLATLGQHFATLEDVAEVKASLLTVQNDLALIKNFLSSQFGAEFPDADNDNVLEEYEEPVQVYQTAKRINSNNMIVQPRQTVTPKITSISGNHQVQKRSQPPPLQRFTVISRGESSNGSVAGRFRNGQASSQQGVYGGESSGDEGKKFRRNFLSLSSLKKQSTSDNSNGAANAGRNRNGSLAVETLRKLSQNPNVKVEPQMGGSKMAAETATQEVYYDDNAEVYNENEEENVYIEGEENYEEDAQLGDDVGETKFVPETIYENDYEEEGTEEIEYEVQEDDTVNYEEYEGEESEMIDPNEMHGLNTTGNGNGGSTTRTMTNGSRSNYSRKSGQRRVSMPNNVGSSQVQGQDEFLKPCKICHEDVPSFTLFHHVVNEHYNGEVPTCHICKKTFTYKQGLISHMRYHDAQKYDKACSYCGKKFIRRSDVIIHERRLHTGERPYICPAPQCNQGFVRRYCLLTHIKTNHGEPYMSQVMAQSGRRKSS